MDPVTISVSAITVTATIVQAGKCLKRTGGICHAPREIEVLSSEVADLRLVLQQRSAVEENSPLGLHISRISAKLGDLETLLDEVAPHPSRLGINRPCLSWFQGRQRAERLRKISESSA